MYFVCVCFRGELGFLNCDDLTVGPDPINEGVQLDVLQRGLAGIARQISKSQDVRAATWNVSSMVG